MPTTPRVLLLVASLCCLALPAWAQNAGAQPKTAEASPEGDPASFTAEMCSHMEATAAARGLPAPFFIRLIWKESRFNPSAVSPKGAQGIAQFMPATAAERGLLDPFEPRTAIVESANFLAELRALFGNLGLAAAAYNAGPERVRDWLDGRRGLPLETRDYVFSITGLAAEDWRNPETAVPEALTAMPELQQWCRTLPTRRGPRPVQIAEAPPDRPWGAQVAANFSRDRALAIYAQIKQRYPAVLGDVAPMVVQERNLSRGTRRLYTVRVGADSRAAAEKICDRLRNGGGACMVAKN